MKIALLIIFYSVFAFMVLKLISTFVSIGFGSPSGETPVKLAEEIFKRAKISKGKKVYELGAGFGNVGVVLAKKFSLKVTGFEISPLPYLIGKVRSIFTKNFTVNFKNINKVDLKDADVVYCFLLPGLLKKLKDKFKKKLKPGSIVISLIFPIPYQKPSQMLIIDKKKVFIYKY